MCQGGNNLDASGISVFASYRGYGYESGKMFTGTGIDPFFTRIVLAILETQLSKAVNNTTINRPVFMYRIVMSCE
jgi:hypothetical protein